MRVARVFFDVHMGQNFRGLMSIAHKAGLKPEADAESFLVFINHAGTKFKLLIGNKYLVYHDNGSRRIELKAIKHLPRALSGKTFEFSRAVEASVLESLKLPAPAQ